MTASLPAEVQAVFGRLITTELTTIDPVGRPITWPVTPDSRLAALRANAGKAWHFGRDAKRELARRG